MLLPRPQCVTGLGPTGARSRCVSVRVSSGWSRLPSVTCGHCVAGSTIEPSRRTAHRPGTPAGWGSPRCQPHLATRHPQRRGVTCQAGLGGLGFDLLTFLGSTVVVIPLFKRLKISPVLGFLFAGVVLTQFHLIREPKEMEALSELGVLFLLFEMGLELSLDRLKALAKYAFGLGTLQVVLCTAIFTAFALPTEEGIGTHLLEFLAHAPSSLVSVHSVDEAVVIGGALSLSSSAFVLQLLNERGEMPTKFGSATLGILLLQDIAVVPFLVLLPLAVSMQSDPTGLLEAAASPAGLLAQLGPTAIKTCVGLGMLLIGGRLLLRRVFELVAQSDNSETFVGLCLLTVAGAALLTERLGLSDTMGAFIAGVLLSESSYKTQVEADIRPFKGLLLGLFFVTTGGSIDTGVLVNNWQVIAWILIGLITIKTSVVSLLGPGFGLTRGESIRTGFMLSQGGEFAFVLLSLASSLRVLPEELNQVLLIVVVLSMALTPGLAEVGKVAGDWVDGKLLPAGGSRMEDGSMSHGGLHMVEEPIVICGFGPHGQMLAALLDQPLTSLPDPLSRAYIAFDLDPTRVQAARSAGYNVVYGDGARAAVLKAAGVVRPKAVAVCLTSNQAAAHRAVESLRASFPSTPLYACGADIRDAAELQEAGADRCVMASTTVGVAMGTEILTRLGASLAEANQAARNVEEAMTLRAHVLADQVATLGSSALEQEGSLMLGKEQFMVGSSRAGTAYTEELASMRSRSSLDSMDDDDTQQLILELTSQGRLPSYLSQPVIGTTAVPSTSSSSSANGMVRSTATASSSSGSAATIAQMAHSQGPEAGTASGQQEQQQQLPQLTQHQAAAAVASSTPAIATAQLDCGSDTECEVETGGLVAGLIQVNASRQMQQIEQEVFTAGVVRRGPITTVPAAATATVKQVSTQQQGPGQQQPAAAASHATAGNGSSQQQGSAQEPGQQQPGEETTTSSSTNGKGTAATQAPSLVSAAAGASRGSTTTQ